MDLLLNPCVYASVMEHMLAMVHLPYCHIFLKVLEANAAGLLAHMCLAARIPNYSCLIPEDSLTFVGYLLLGQRHLLTVLVVDYVAHRSIYDDAWGKLSVIVGL